MNQGWIIQQGVRVARIESTSHGYRIWQPDDLPERPSTPGWIATTIPFESLPLELPYEKFPNFFLNMLPEGSRLAALMNTSHVSKDDPLGLLFAALGEPPGDTFLQPDEHATLARRVDSKWDHVLKERDFTWSQLTQDLLKNIQVDAISGVQDKVSRGSLTVPLTRTRTAQILKMPTGSYPLIAENEFYTMNVARKCGFEVSRMQLVYDGEGQAAFAIERFDRMTQRGVVKERFHLEDGCQLMDEPPGRKYQIRLQDLTKQMMNWCTSRSQTVVELAALIGFSYIVGNADMHAKNISLIWRKGICNLSPAYDLLTTLPYPDHEKQMALKLYGRDNRLRLRDVLDLAQNNDVRTEALVIALRRRLSPIPREIQNFGTVGFDEKTTDYVIGEVLQRYESFFAKD